MTQLSPQTRFAVISDSNHILFPDVDIQINISCSNAYAKEWEIYAGKDKKVVYSLKFELPAGSTSYKNDKPEFTYGFYPCAVTAKVTDLKPLSATSLLIALTGLKKCLIKSIDMKRQKSGCQFAIATEILEQNSNLAVAAPTQKVRDEIKHFRELMGLFQEINLLVVRDDKYSALVTDFNDAAKIRDFRAEIDIIRKLIYLTATRYIKKYLDGDLRTLQELLSKNSLEEELQHFNSLLGHITKTHAKVETKPIEPTTPPPAAAKPEDPVHKARLLKFEEKSNALKPEVQRYLKILIDNYSAAREDQGTHVDTRSKFCGLIDAVLEYPWGVRTEDCFDFDLVEKRFSQELYGLEPVKTIMYAIIAVMKQRRKDELFKSQGKVLLLVGEPGVGKTASIKSLSKAIGRNFQSVDLGGVNRQEDIKGQSFTFIGSIPGLINDAIKRSGSVNPVIALEEIDKMTAIYGDPSAALMAFLDPERNQSIRDMYYPDPISFDYSEVLFACTANSLKGIYPPLLNRMRPIEVPGYTKEDKIKIAANYLIPKWAAETGLDRLADYSVEESAVVSIIDTYAEKEKGVRRLEDKIEELFEAIATQRELHSDMLKEVVITPEKIIELLQKSLHVSKLGFKA